VLSVPSTDEILAIGESLAGRPLVAADPVRAGGNNCLYRLEDEAGERFALKLYPPQEADRRDRLGAEFTALYFLGRHDVTAVPRAIGRDAARHCALYQWIEGEPVTAPGPADIDALAAFLVDLQRLTSEPGAADLRPASAACLAPADGVAQYRERLARLREVAAQFPELHEFVEGRLVPVGEAVLAGGLVRLAEYGIDAALPLAPAFRALSPSDFGFHNALRRPDGRLVFLDFEYFGWDDPAKMVADVILHPGMALDEAVRRRFLSGVIPFFCGRDPLFNRRFRFVLPVCALIWCLILLNEYLPERWWRRNLAATRADPAKVRSGQLTKAQRMLDWIEDNGDGHGADG
jgi:hypothetical protein